MAEPIAAGISRQAPLILASASPRRAELLKQLGAPFEIITSHADEIEDASLGPATVAETNARLKARAVAATHPDRLVLGADTVVALAGRLFGKPRSKEHAAEMLRALAGQTHQVITGVALTGPGVEECFSAATAVTFRALDSNRIQEYLSKVHVLDKAGAYAIQEHGDLIIESIHGSRANVVGLPLERLGELLRARGYLTR